MTVVVTFEDYTPSARADGLAWTAARVEEAAAPTGPWSPVDTISLSPLDTDPSNPIPRSFTTTHGTLAVGYYRVVFIDAAAHEEATAAVAYPAIGSIRASLADVGAVLHARTNVMGSEVGTFNDETHPKGDEVLMFIDAALREVLLWLPVDLPERAQPFAKHLVALRAAMLVEVSYDPERTSSAEETTYAQLKELYDEGKALLLESLADRDEGVTRRIASMSVISPTLAPYTDELREAMAPDPWPWP